MKIKVFGCPSIKRELYFIASFCPHNADIETVSPEIPAEQLQQLIESASADRIVLAFGQRRLEGLHSKAIPLVVPRAHDCAHLLLGSAERYRRAFSENEDQPCWLNSFGCGFSSKAGSRCAVKTGFLPFDGETFDHDVREYVADLSLLKSLLDMSFDNSRAIVVPQNSRIIADPVEIISFEPL